MAPAAPHAGAGAHSGTFPLSRRDPRSSACILTVVPEEVLGLDQDVITLPSSLMAQSGPWQAAGTFSPCRYAVVEDARAGAQPAPSLVWFCRRSRERGRGDKSATTLCLVYSFAHGIPVVTALLLPLFFFLPLFFE